MSIFMQDTPDPRPAYGMEYWCGDLPFVYQPQNYWPDAVAGAGDKPVAVVWYEYLFELLKTARKLDSKPMLEHWKDAADFYPIGDLLAASRAYATDYWKEAIAHAEGIYANTCEQMGIDRIEWD